MISTVESGPVTMRIVVQQGEMVGLDKRFAEKTLYVGRQDGCHVQLTGDENVQPRHLMIFEEGGQWLVEPLHDQYHRTLFNGNLLHDRQPINDEDEFTVGNYKITVYPSVKAAEDRDLPVQVIARGFSEIQDTLGYTLEDMKLPENTLVKERMETFSLSKGRIEYIAKLALDMLEVADVRSLMEVVIDKVLEDFSGNCVWMGFRTDDEGHLYLSAGKNLMGRPIDAPPMAEHAMFATVECCRALVFQNIEELPDRSALSAPLMSPDGCLGMLYLESQPGKQKFNVADLDTLVFLGTQIAITVDKVLREQAERIDAMERSERELTREVQSRVAPWQLPQWPDLQLAVLQEFGEEAGADFYDVVPLADKQAMVLIGEPADNAKDRSITVTQVCASFRIGAVHRDTPHALMRQISWLVYTSANEPRPVSMGLLSIDPRTGEFMLCHAGTVHAYMVNASGKVQKVKKPNNPLVGEQRKSKFEAIQGWLASGQTMVLTTSGIFDIQSQEEKRFKEKRLIELLSDSYTQPPSNILHDLAEEVMAFTGGEKPNRDITVMLLRKSGGGE